MREKGLEREWEKEWGWGHRERQGQRLMKSVREMREKGIERKSEG